MSESTIKPAQAGLSPSLALRYSLWELRHSFSKTFYWVLCLAIGVAAVVSVGGLGASLDGAIRSEARSLLAADLAIRSAGDLPPAVVAAIDNLEGSRSAQLREMVTLVRRGPVAERTEDNAGIGGESEVVADGAASSNPSDSEATLAPKPKPKRAIPSTLLVELRAIEAGYPFYGDVEIELPATGPGALPARESAGERDLEALLGSDGVLVSQDALDQLALAPGDRLRVGRAELVIRGVLIAEPDRIPGALSIGPPVLMSMAGFEQTGLSNLGNFVRRKTLIALANADALNLDRAKALLEKAAGDDPSITVETYREAQPALREGLERMESYLGLVALLSLLIGGVGVAQGVRAWIASRLDSLAILKCLGTRPRELFFLILFQVVVLGFVGSLLGGVFGLASLLLLPEIMKGVIPPEAIDPFQPIALLQGTALGVGVAVAFSLPPLLSVLRVSPARVFRHDAEPLPGSIWQPAVVSMVLVASVAALAAVQSRSLLLAAQFVGGVIVTAGALLVGGLALSRLAALFRRESQPFWIRNGLAALGRPGAGALGAIAALGLGLLVLLTMALVQGHLEDQLRADLPSDAPTAFLIEIRRDQWPGVERLLEEGGASRIDSAPVVLARLDQIDGKKASEVARESGERWVFTRDIRMTYLDKLADDNRIVESIGSEGGHSDVASSKDRHELWSQPGTDEVSVELEFAREIGIELGSTIEIVLRNQSYRLRVTSLREVDWDGFGINFFLVVEPGVFDQAPQTVLAAARLPEGSEQSVQDAIADAFPNVTVFRIRPLLDRVVGLLEKLNLGVRVLGSFTVFAGLAILAGAIATTSARRGRETALLKTLGMTRIDVARTFATEYALIGLVASAIACLGGLGLAWFVVTQRMDIDWEWRVGDLLWVIVGGPVLSVLAGLAATMRALSRRPIEVLRDA